MQDEYISAILSFIDRLKNYTELHVENTSMSTQVFGEYNYVMKAITLEIEKSFEIPQSVFILKIINSDLRIYS